MELGDDQDWEEREKQERLMGDSLLKWLGFDKPPKQRVRHRVWKKQLEDCTRQLKLGADRARGGKELELIDGVEVVRGLLSGDSMEEEEETSDQEEEEWEGHLSGAEEDGEKAMLV